MNESAVKMDGAAKERLKRLTLMAVDRYRNNESFTIEEVQAYFDALSNAFGSFEASGFLNYVLNTIKRHGFDKLNKDFGRALVVAIGEHVRVLS
jgi:hypothetical protein